MPGESSKLEGALSKPLAIGVSRGAFTLGANRFFDGRVFDPQDIEGISSGFCGALIFALAKQIVMRNTLTVMQ